MKFNYQSSRLPILRLVMPQAIAENQPYKASWQQFRGPAANSIAFDQNIPADLISEKNLIWKTQIPKGHSSPCIWEDKIFLTGYYQNAFQIMCLDRKTGKKIWGQSREMPELGRYDHVAAAPANPTPTTNGKTVLFYFDDYGLIATDLDGAIQWEKKMSSTNNSFSYGASPIIVDNKILLNRDGGLDSSLLCLDLKSGTEVWRAMRPDMIPSFCTPYFTESNGEELILSGGSSQLVAYSLRSGEEKWNVTGLPSFVCPSPTASNGVIVFGGWTTAHVSGKTRVESTFGEDSGVSEVALQNPESFFQEFDTDKDGKLTKSEFPPSRAKDAFNWFDSNANGFVSLNELSILYSETDIAPGRNVIVGIKQGGNGDITKTNVLWELRRGLPYVASPLVVNEKVYLFAKGGYATCVNLQTGKPYYLKERLGIGGEYYASPIAVDNKIIVCSHRGTVFFLAQSENFKLLRSVDLGEKVFATPAVVDSKLYIRSSDHLWAWGNHVN